MSSIFISKTGSSDSFHDPCGVYACIRHLDSLSDLVLLGDCSRFLKGAVTNCCKSPA